MVGAGGGGSERAKGRNRVRHLRYVSATSSNAAPPSRAVPRGPSRLPFPLSRRCIIDNQLHAAPAHTLCRARRPLVFPSCAGVEVARWLCFENVHDWLPPAGRADASCRRSASFPSHPPRVHWLLHARVAYERHPLERYAYSTPVALDGSQRALLLCSRHLLPTPEY
jgi:hypothetical protein